MSGNVIKVLGVVVSIGTAILSIVGDSIHTKRQEALIAEKVAEAVSKLAKGES